MTEITLVTIDLDSLDLDDETRALLEMCIPDEPVDMRELFTEEVLAEALIVADLVSVH